jgi:hypothetical protein
MNSQLVSDAYGVVRSTARALDGLELMSDPIPAISESYATGVIAASDPLASLSRSGVGHAGAARRHLTTPLLRRVPVPGTSLQNCQHRADG